MSDVNVTGLDFWLKPQTNCTTVAHKPSKTIKESKKAKAESVTQAEATTTNKLKMQ